MSKKKFLDGIDDIFAANAVESEVNTFDDHAGRSENNQPTHRKTSHHKTFVTNLDSLLSELTEDPFFSETTEMSDTKGKSKTRQTGGYGAPVSGLDALIRQTLTITEVEDEATGKKRISVAVDKTQLDRLKTIARMEGAFMKDIIAKLIDSYVQKYAQEKGVDI